MFFFFSFSTPSIPKSSLYLSFCFSPLYKALYLADAHADRHDMIRGVIIENTFTCIDDMISEVFKPLRYVKWLSANRWRNIDIAGRLRFPVLWIVGKKDDLVPPTQMQALYDCATVSPKSELFELPLGEFCRLGPLFLPSTSNLPLQTCTQLATTTVPHTTATIHVWPSLCVKSLHNVLFFLLLSLSLSPPFFLSLCLCV